MRSTLIPSALCALALVLPAQEERTALSFVPGDGHVVAWFDGPGALRAAFGDTRAGRMFADDALLELLAPWLDDFVQQMRGEFNSPALPFDEAVAMFEGYRGRLTVGLSLGLADLILGGDVLGPDTPPLEGWAVLTLSPDGETDLQRLADALAEGVEETWKLVDFESAGRTLRARIENEYFATLPFVHDSHLVMILGTDLETTVDACLTAAGDSLDAAIELPEAPIGAWLRLDSMESAVRAWTGARGDSLAELGVDLFFDTLGFGTLRELSLTARPAGAHTVMAARLAMTGEHRGLVGAFLTSGNRGAPKSLDLIPVQRDAWSITPIDLNAAYRSIGAVVDGMSDVFDVHWSDLEEQFATTFRVRLAEDLLDHVGQELLTIGTGAVGVDDDDPDPMAEWQGDCYGVTLDDPTAFGKSFETLLRSRGLHAARKTEVYRGFQVRRITVLGTPLYYAISAQLFLVALGDRGARELRAVLDEEVARRKGSARAALPERLEERLDHAMPGWQGIGTANLVTLAGATLAAMRQRGDLEDDLVSSIVSTWMNTFIDLLDRHQLATFVSVTRVEGDTATIQVIW